MKTLILKTKTAVYEIIQNPDNTLTVYNEPGNAFKDAGMLIMNLGGIEEVMKRTIPIDISFKEYLDKERAIADHAANKRAEKVQILLRQAAEPGISAIELFDIFMKIYEYDKANRIDLIDVFFFGKNALNKQLSNKLRAYSVKPNKKGSIVITVKYKFYKGPKKYTSKSAIRDLIQQPV